MTRRTELLAAALLCACALACGGGAPARPSPESAAAAGPPAAERVDEPREAVGSGGRVVARYVPEPDPVPLDASFELRLSLREAEDPGRPVEGAEVYVTAWMPDHGHGMNRQTKVTEVAPGEYRVRGMLFHMPGHWELYVDVVEGGLAERVQFDVNLD